MRNSTFWNKKKEERNVDNKKIKIAETEKNKFVLFHITHTKKRKKECKGVQVLLNS